MVTVMVMEAVTVMAMEVQPHNITYLGPKKYERNAHIF